MNTAIAVLFWVGLASVLYEWFQALRGGPAISRREKKYFWIGLVFAVGILPLLIAVGTHPPLAAHVFAVLVAAMMNGWVLQRRVRRPRR